MKHTTFALAFAVAVFSFSACVSVADAREGGAQRECRWEDRCGNVGSGKRYAAFDECLTAIPERTAPAEPGSGDPCVDAHIACIESGRDPAECDAEFAACSGGPVAQ